MDRKLMGNFGAIYKKGNKEDALKNMENLKTRLPGKILVTWEEILEEFEKNKENLKEITDPNSEIFKLLVDEGFDKESLLTFMKDGEIINKEALCSIIGFLKHDIEDFSLNDNNDLVDYNLYEDGEFRTFEEISTMPLDEFLIPGEDEKLNLIEEMKKEIDEDFDEEEIEDAVRNYKESKGLEKDFIIQKFSLSGAFIQKGKKFELLSETAEEIDFNDEDEIKERIDEIAYEIIRELKRIEPQDYEITIFKVEHPQDYSLI